MVRRLRHIKVTYDGGLVIRIRERGSVYDSAILERHLMYKKDCDLLGRMVDLESVRRK